jgi:carboxylate-amine ligase
MRTVPGSDIPSPPTTNVADLRAVFDAAAPATVGLEEEAMLLDARTLDLAPRALEVLGQLGGDDRFKPELPASQLEIVLPPTRTVGEAAAALAAARADLQAAVGDELRLACAGLHPFAATEGPLNAGLRYDATADEYGMVARRQLVFALQVHVAIRGADRALAVYNAARSYLPELAALAANAPFHGGRDTGMASARPLVGENLPRQGVPPAMPSWEAFAAAFDYVSWGGGGRWWWELRPHEHHGTLELRVPDAQTTVKDAAAVAATGHALLVWLAERFDAGEPLAVHETWRIEENRWSSTRWGVAGEMRDLDSGEREPTRERLHRLLDTLAPVAERLGCAGELQGARELVEANGAIRMREAAGGDPHAATRWLMERYAP